MKKDIVYLDDNFEISKLPTEIEVDEQIVDIIINLNKKGYKTKFCCSGHYKVYPIIKDKLVKKDYTKKELNSILNVEPMKLINEDEEYCYYECCQTTATNCYISFEKEIELPFYPVGFTYNNDNNSLYCRILIYEDWKKSNKPRSETEVNLDIKNANEQLKTWVEKLPKIES